MAFIFVLSLVAAMSTIGFIATLSAERSALPSQAAENNNVVANNQPNNNAAVPTGPTVNPDAIKLTSSDRVIGDPNAPITIVEFSDFQCPYCQNFHPNVQQLLDNYPGKIKWVYKHFPLSSIHPSAQKAAEASECAGDQGKFWEYADKLFAEQALLSQPNYFSTAAGQLSLNTSTFDDCLTSGKHTSKVRADQAMGEAAGVSGTPGSFINDQYVAGAKSYQSLEAIVQSLL